ncbi:hypothetical protein IGI04_008415 [Brassica rapa subsp. trilocularis]|uniref:Uncharacterized protein n=1 Tax=Brassica rapa subsp. trilocularis TaxID=1813537 RepID=A0ABQ7NMK1_BRACM|nr:hypothetical protein IGI04_008415 [Brassica rapa subsp. trilocularis]
MSHKKHGAPPLAENGEKRTPSACQAAKPKEGSGTRFMLKEHVSNLVTQNSRICFCGEKRSWTFLRFCLIQIQIFSNNICAKFKIRKSRGYKEKQRNLETARGDCWFKKTHISVEVRVLLHFT